MSTTPSPTQSESSKSSLPVRKPLVEVLAINPADLKNDQPPSAGLRLGKRAPLALALITFCIGVAATSAWQSYGNAAREVIARSSTRLGWLAPQSASVARNTSDTIVPGVPAVLSPDQQQQLDAMSLDLDALRQRIDRITSGQEQMTRNVDHLTAGQEQMMRNVDHLAAGQEQMTRELAKLQAIEQQILRKNSEPQPRPAPRPAQTRTVR